MAVNVVPQIQVQDMERRQAVANANLEGNQVGRAKAGQVGMEEDLKEKDTRFERDGQTTKQLESQGSTGDNNRDEHLKH